MDPVEAAELRTGNSRLRAENAQLKAVIVQLRGVIADLRAVVDRQQAQIDRLTRSAFGRSSERLDPPAAPDPTVAVVADPPASSLSRRPGHGRRALPADLPVERVEIDLPAAERPCPCCGEARVRVGLSEPSRRTDYRPASLFVRETYRVSYACRRCEQAGGDPQFARPPLPAEPVPRGSVGAGLLAHVVVSKFTDHLPLARQESMLARLGWPASRSTLCGHLRRAAEVLEPLYRSMIARIKLSHALHADETPVTLLRPRRSAWAWAYLGDAANPYTAFDLTVGRGRAHPAAFLGDYRGFVQADAYAGYNAVHENVRHVGCWMHARRGFFEARGQDPLADEALALIGCLYDVERRADEAGLCADGRLELRRSESAPALDAIAVWLARHGPGARPKSPLGQAIGYAVNQWPTLARYASDGRLAIDNGPAERAIRPLALGRNNWLFIGGDAGLASAAVLLSVCASARRHLLNPWLYVRDLLTRLPARPPGADLSDLLPDKYRPD